jgi:hypothetical protein
MRVRGRDGEGGWLTASREHVVLCIEVEHGRGALLRIEAGEANTPALFPVDEVDQTDGRIPQIWRVKTGRGGLLDIGPPAWLEDGFWEAYFDGKPEAMDEYRRGRDAIYADSR